MRQPSEDLDWTLAKAVVDSLRSQEDGNRKLIEAAGGDSLKYVTAAQRLGTGKRPEKSKNIPHIEQALELRRHSISALAHQNIRAFYDLGNVPEVNSLVAALTGVPVHERPNLPRTRQP